MACALERGWAVNTTSPASPWLSGEVAGTRFAAPIVAGEAALMMQLMIRS